MPETSARSGFTVVIPARLASSRLPNKPLVDIAGLPKVVREAQRAMQSQAQHVVVAADDAQIVAACEAHGIDALLTRKDHLSGSDRLAEACQLLNLSPDTVVVNVQGDEPFINAEPLAKVIEVFKNDTNQQVDLASLMREITNENEINNPNNVKVVVDQNGFALYFSRSVIPYPREINVGVRYMQHIGIYAFRKQALLDFYSLPMKSLEASEKLEQLRYLEFGKRIKMVETTHVGIGIYTAEDLEKERQLLK